MNKKILLLVFFTLFIIRTQANVNQELTYKKLNKILLKVNNENISETQFYKLIPLVDEYVNILNETSTEHKYLNNEFPNFRLLVTKFGFSLKNIRNKLIYNVKGNDDYWSLLSLAMFNDLEAKNIILGKIFSSKLKEERFAYVKLLAYYNIDIQETELLLRYLKKDEWYPPLKHLISFITDNINKPKSTWEKFLLWDELKKMDWKLLCDVYNFKIDNLDNPLETGSNTNMLSRLTQADRNLLKSKNINPKNIELIWKNTKLFKYVIRLKGNKNRFIIINNSDEISDIKILSHHDKKLYDLFTIGNRYFFIVSVGNFYKTKFIEELIWNYDNDEYNLSTRFVLGDFYKELFIKDNHVYVTGKNWKYKINKDNAIIESATLCGKNVVINQAL